MLLPGDEVRSCMCRITVDSPPLLTTRYGFPPYVCEKRLYLLSTTQEDTFMIENEFRRPVSVDTAPRGSLCEWCGKPAEVQLTAIGGIAHNESGLFCNSCGQEFTRAITSTAGTITSTDATQQAL